MEPKYAVLELFLAKMNCSTLQAFLLSRMQEAEKILSKQEVRPMKTYPLHPVSNLILGSSTTVWIRFAGPGRLQDLVLLLVRFFFWLDISREALANTAIVLRFEI